MDNSILNGVKNLFPGVNLDKAINQANQALQGKNESDAPAILQSVGVTENGINNLYNKYGNDMKARAVLALVGTSPDKLRQQALGLLSGNSTHAIGDPHVAAPNPMRKYPRLK